MNHPAQRGQALMEMAIALPLVMLSLYVLYWTIRFAVVQERAESAVRYAQQILSQHNVYTAYSFESMYDATAATPQLKLFCATPPPQMLSATAGLTINGMNFPGAGSWAADSADSQCTLSHQTLHGMGLSRDYILASEQAQVSVKVNALFRLPFFGLGSMPLLLQSHSIANYQAASIGDLMQCYPGMAQTINASLRPQSATPSFVLTATTLQDQPPVTPPTINPGCVNQPPGNVTTTPGTPIPQAPNNATPNPPAQPG